MVRCPTEHELELFLEGTSTPEERLRIERHRAECATCRRWLEEASADEELLAGVRRAMEHADRAATPVSEEPPRLARYRVLRRLGGGGMGVVWEAEQQSPKRRVALKLMRPHIVSPRALRRFEHEAQVLARLDHPGIARVHEADMLETHGERQPFFAMELVEGQPLTDWADQRSLEVRARVELLAQVCDAVQHAHQKGVVHRDLKPSNILVTDAGRPKVLDFGVARTLEEDGEAVSMRSEVGQIIGTLPYMSPEQVLGLPEAVDTRADVYALGVLLYRLLTGKLPLDMSGVSLPEGVRRVSELEPAPLGSHERALRGDLEAITARALEKDREHRYPSAAALAEDLRRWLRDEPVSARPPSTLDQLRKLARRNRLATALVLLALVLLVGGISATSWQAMRAGRAEEEERKRAEELAQQIKRLGVVNEFYKAILDAGNIKKAGNPAGYTVRALLIAAAERLEREPLQDPVIEAELRVTLGDALNSLGLGERAIEHLERAVELREQTTGPRSRQTAGALNALGVSLYEQDRGEEALGRFEETLAIYDALAGVEPAEWLEPRRATTLSNIGMLRVQRGDLERAEPLLVEALEIHQRLLGPEDRAIATDLAFLASLEWQRGNGELAIDLQREAVEMNARLDAPSGSLTMHTAFTLGFMLGEVGKFQEAEEILLRSLETIEDVLSADHPSHAQALVNLSWVRGKAGDVDGAVAYARDAVASCESPAARAEMLPNALSCLARALDARGDAAEAAEVRAEVATLLEAASAAQDR